MKIEIEAIKWAYHPLSQTVLLESEDGDDYVVLKRVKLPKNQIFESKKARQEVVLSYKQKKWEKN